MKKVWATLWLPIAVITLIPFAVAVAIMYLSIEEGVRVIKEQF